MIGFKIEFAAAALEGRRVRAYAQKQRRGETGARAYAHEAQVGSHDGAGRPHVGPYVGEERESFRQLIRSRQGVVINDNGEIQGFKDGIMVGLAVHKGKVGVLGLFRRIPGLYIQPEVADHGEVIGTGHFVDAADVDIACAPFHDAPECLCGPHGVRVGGNQDAPVLIPADGLKPAPDALP